MRTPDKEYKELLVSGILEWDVTNQFTREQLESKSVRVLERIYDDMEVRF